MDLGKQLIESGGTRKNRQWKGWAASVVIHLLVVAVVLFVSLSATQKVAAEDKQIPTFIEQGAAPPPPPPPPPPPASHAASTPKSQPVQVKPIEIPKPTFVQPTTIPKDIPPIVQPTKVVENAPATSEPVAPVSDGPSGPPDGVVGGVEGGVQGGTVGGEVGGVVGGELGGVKGGVLGGKVGGEGTGPGDGPGKGASEAKPTAPPSGPLRVGGDVLAPTVTHRVDPNYTEMAKKAHVTGVVIVEAIISKDGTVRDVKIIKGLPMGLSEEAERAVKEWRFKPGTLGGQPVDVIFNLTVTFQLNGA